MKKILSVLLLAAACILSGCEPKGNDPDLAKMTIRNKTGHPLYITVYEFKPPFDNYIMAMKKVNNLGHITEYIKPGQYSIEAQFSRANYYDSYLWTFKPGENRTFTFRDYK